MNRAWCSLHAKTMEEYSAISCHEENAIQPVQNIRLLILTISSIFLIFGRTIKLFFVMY
jgi:hypothetical protein